MTNLKSPYVFFGGKREVADLIWQRFGNPYLYVEPFFGSGAVLLCRPHEPQIETINDVNHFIANVWRALKADPEAVAYYAERPVSEIDLHAIHDWLVFHVQNETDFIKNIREDFEYYDAKIAGLWIWGASCWIGSGWCPIDDVANLKQQTPRIEKYSRGTNQYLSQQSPRMTSRGQGVDQYLSKKLPNVSPDKDNAFMHQYLSQKRPNIGDGADGRGSLAISQKRPLVHRRGSAVTSDEYRDYDGQTQHFCGLHVISEPLLQYFIKLHNRIRRVRTLCGDWTRCITPAVLNLTDVDRHTVTALFLDPPYADTAGRTKNLYSADSLTVAHDVREWAIANGSSNPRLRICLAGYEGEHEMPDDWDCVPWKNVGGYGNSSQSGKNMNRYKERLWFNKFCLAEPMLFEKY